MIRKVVGFDWDDGNTAKCEKHDLSTTMIEEFFSRPVHVIGDVKHSSVEQRLIAVGRSADGRGMFVGFTYRSSNEGEMIRPITARYMHKREIRRYEKAIAKTEE